MSDDLLYRLRLWGNTINVRAKLRELCLEAADEIERLRSSVGEDLGIKNKNEPDVI